MTAFVMHNGVIGADKLVFKSRCGYQAPYFEDKLTLSKCKTFVFGICGDTPQDSYSSRLESLIRVGLHKLILDGDVRGLDIVAKYLIDNGTDGWLMVLTKDFVITSNKKQPRLLVETNNTTICCGTGEHCCRVGLYNGLSVEEAIAFAVDNIESCGGEASVYKASDLMDIERVEV